MNAVQGTKILFHIEGNVNTGLRFQSRSNPDRVYTIRGDKDSGYTVNGNSFRNYAILRGAVRSITEAEYLELDKDILGAVRRLAYVYNIKIPYGQELEVLVIRNDLKEEFKKALKPDRHTAYLYQAKWQTEE